MAKVWFTLPMAQFVLKGLPPLPEKVVSTGRMRQLNDMLEFEVYDPLLSDTDVGPDDVGRIFPLTNLRVVAVNDNYAANLNEDGTLPTAGNRSWRSEEYVSSVVYDFPNGFRCQRTIQDAHHQDSLAND
jgi:hypothetical protein